MTDQDLLSRQAFESDLLAKGQKLTVRLAEGQEYENVSAVVGDQHVGEFENEAGVDLKPARLVRLLDTFTTSVGDTVSLKFTPGSVLVIDGVEWAFESIATHFTWGAYDLIAARAVQIDSAGATNRRRERYSAGGRRRRLY